MITELLLKLLQNTIVFFESVRPEWEWTLPEGVTTAVAMMKGFNNVVPVNEVLICASLYVGLITALVGWKWLIKVIDWIADVIP